MSASGDRLTEVQRAAIHKIGNVRGRTPSIEDVNHNISLRSLAGRGLVRVTVELTDRGKLIAGQIAAQRKTRKPR